MAAGEWISIKARARLFRGILRDIKAEIRQEKPHLISEVVDALFKSGHSAIKAAKEIGGDDLSA